MVRLDVLPILHFHIVDPAQLLTLLSPVKLGSLVVGGGGSSVLDLVILTIFTLIIITPQDVETVRSFLSLSPSHNWSFLHFILFDTQPFLDEAL